MQKIILPLVLIASSCFGQNDREAYKLALPALNGSTVNHVGSAFVFDAHGNTGKELIQRIKTKADLGMKRNGLSYKSKEMEPDKWSRISIFVHTVDNVRGPVGYVWSVSVERFAGVGPTRFQPEFAARYNVASGKSGSGESLVRVIDSVLDEIFLAYLELPKEKKD